MTDEQSEVVWCNYEWAWGGSYKDYYKEQSLNNISIDKDHLQPLKFQGQFFDQETSLHYNRFRYYDSDVGMFIQRDPIGLLGGVNVFAYAPNPIHWVDVLGLNPNCKKCKSFLQEDCDSILKKEGIVIGKHRDIKKIGGQYDSHHIYQDAAVNNIKKIQLLRCCSH